MQLGEITLPDDFFEHHGVKGMKWGVRKDRSSSTPTDVTLHLNKAGQITKTSGGQNNSASEDAVRTASTHQKARSSGTQALSNKELQDLVTRMNLEQQYSRLTTTEKGTVHRGHDKIKSILGIAKTGTEVYNTVNSPAVKAVKLAFEAKKAAKTVGLG